MTVEAKAAPRSGHILVVDDERSMRDFLEILLRRAGHQVKVASSAADAMARLGSSARAVEHGEGSDFDVVITDLNMPGPRGMAKEVGLEVLSETKRRFPDTQVIVVTAFASAETAMDAMRKGAYDYLTKPFKVEEVTVVVQRALEKRWLLHENSRLREELGDRYGFGSLIGKSPPMRTVFELIRKVAPSKTNILIVGESGTGKELVARALHWNSPRRSGPFIAINCGAIPEQLLESELFGHVKGAFTGATSRKEGLLPAASGGTLFLDEISELPLGLQVKLLRALQERVVKPVGGVEDVDIDIRLLAATNRDLEEEVQRGTFRKDLYYRLNVIEIALPPLRRRRDDLPLLIDHFLGKFADELGKRLTAVSPEALALLLDYDYPGNVRELENLIERAATLEVGDRITPASLPPLKARPVQHPAGDLPADGIQLDRVLQDVERSYIEKALERTGGVRTAAAKLLGVSFRSLRYRLEKLGFDVGESNPEVPTDSSEPID